MATVAEPKRRARTRTRGTTGGDAAATTNTTTPAAGTTAPAATQPAATARRVQASTWLAPIVLHLKPGAPKTGPWAARYDLRDMESISRVLGCKITPEMSLDQFVFLACEGGGEVRFQGAKGLGGGGQGGEGLGGGGPAATPKRGRTRKRKSR